MATNIYLGYEFLTDMFTLDIKYDTQKMVSNADSEEKNILRSAATTLHEALKKAVSLSLDIDYNEINGGWRTRFEENGEAHIEMFFYDNLTSGAGYSSLLGKTEVLDDVFKRAYQILTECTCSRACKNCLDNFIIKEIMTFLIEHLRHSFWSMLLITNIQRIIHWKNRKNI